MKPDDYGVAVETKVIAFARRHSVFILRLALGVVFVWFGTLKIFEVSPVGDLVARMLPFVPPAVVVVTLGVLEVLVGLGFLTGRAIRLTLVIFLAEMSGTLATLVVQHDLVFRMGNPVLLSVLGEFITKNIVLIAAGLTVLGAVPTARRNEGAGRLLQRIHRHTLVLPVTDDVLAMAGSSETTHAHEPSGKDQS